jgi:hypothetical protein
VKIVIKIENCVGNVWIDGKKIDKVKEYCVRHRAGGPPIVEITTLAIPNEFEYLADGVTELKYLPGNINVKVE